MSYTSVKVYNPVTPENPIQVSNFNRMSSMKQYAISFTRLQTQKYIRYNAFS